MRTERLVSLRAVALGCGLAGTLIAAGADAQESAPATQATPEPVLPALTLPEALAYAHAHQPQIRTALAQITVEEKRADVPRGQWTPLVGAAAELVAGTSNVTTASILPAVDVAVPSITASPGVTTSTANLRPYANTFVGASLGQELFDFGRIAAQSAASDALVVAAQRASEATRLAVDFSVEESYFAVYAAKGVQAAAEGAYQRAKEHFELSQAGVHSGLRSPIELTRAQAELARFDIARIRARSNVTLSQAVLAASIGSTDPGYDVSGPPPSFPELPSLREVIEKASERDPRVREALARLAAQEKATSAIGAELRPNVLGVLAVSGRAGGTAPSDGKVPAGDGWVPDVPNWDAGLVLSWPILDGVVLARRNASKAEEQAKRETLFLARQQELTDIQQTYVRLDRARLVLPALQRSVDGALANYAQAEARFKAGLGNQVELADADNLREEAEVQLALGRFQLAQARADFGRAIAEGL